MSEASELCGKAAELISENGLHKRGLWEGASHGQKWVPGRPLCMMGALFTAAGYPHHMLFTKDANFKGPLQDACRLVARELRLIADHAVISVWNDNPTTTKEDVVSVLKRASGS